MTLNIDKCPDSLSARSDKTSIHPEGLEDRLDVNVEYICDCDCQHPEQAVSIIKTINVEYICDCDCQSPEQAVSII